ncbi:ribonuclease M5 [Pectinatus haikarae]|uniref:Ribonuclease M5 n=1 Tax=Pectinatus haikarae TaxID=349096 RepID=A0ABT9YAC6_9FIRM|nr:ribonuclease M5 [Pectinatus haikarae]MDQ0204802.1 ribonuclease M5 [Pectinatus haikarae]
MIKEVLIVEGKMDVVAVNKAVEADCIITGGFGLNRGTVDNIRHAYKKRGIIILTDPDSAGERIRKWLTRRFPKAKHAFIPVEEASAHNDIGVEQASPESIRNALKKVRTESVKTEALFTAADLLQNGLSGGKNSSMKRAEVGAVLGLGYANAKIFLQRLNTYGVTRKEFMDTITDISKKIENNEVD